MSDFAYLIQYIDDSSDSKDTVVCIVRSIDTINGILKDNRFKNTCALTNDQIEILENTGSIRTDPENYKHFAIDLHQILQ